MAERSSSWASSMFRSLDRFVVAVEFHRLGEVAEEALEGVDDEVDDQVSVDRVELVEPENGRAVVQRVEEEEGVVRELGGDQGRR